MALRTSISDVRALLQDESADVFTFIQVASDIVDEYLLGNGVSDVLMARIESFLACHFYLLSNPELVRRQYDKAGYQYVQPKIDEGFRATKWGQMAIAIDPSGSLECANRSQAALYVL